MSDSARADDRQQDTPSFTGLGLPAPLLRVLDEQGVTVPFPIQTAALPNALAGRDVLGRGPTGSGKTLAFGLGLLARTAGRRAESKEPLALVLVPTRELAQQVGEALTPYAEALRLRLATVVGGVSVARQAAALRDGAEIVVATPGRLHDLVARRGCRLGRVRITVLDEADQMCDMGFLPQVTELLDQVRPDGQRMLFSATLDRDVDELVQRYLRDPAVHEADTASDAHPAIAHHLLVVHGPDRYAVATEIAARDGRVVLFLDTKHAVDRLTAHLRASGVAAAALHSGKAQPQRTRTLAQFKEGRITALVATNVGARGLHVDDLDLVVNVDPATDPKDYVHRAGRTARAGRSGTVVTLVLSGQRRETSQVMAEAGITAKVTKVRSGEAELSRITGAKAPSGAPLDGSSAAEKPKNHNTPFRGLGSTKDTKSAKTGSGGRASRKSNDARKLAEARKAARVRRGN
ncbi:DEAD/DEAH box helicase [Streptomyces sp. VRA16 Mangrove soil]|uniref:DEAD/DEAH box helicase n=1 Tax=Streptomyces sp. VRA16 Mangrove soil TaxID=2817434 RepID=UPI001A9F80D2|nr:DEAD/DEAH box helicase [Streptomyces sp. VRA16 Mangrove soil]MBO1330374.1 DEAD/DEAH box helicase [Streptomyces sp. VRA16 Mangrove soil]